MNSELAEPNIPFLSTKSNNKIFFIRYLNTEIKKEMILVLREIDTYLFLKRKRIEIEHNADDFFNYLTYCNKMLYTRKDDDTFDLNPIYIEVNRKFINFSTSLRVLTEAVEKKIKNAYSPEDIEYKELEETRCSFYDSYFSYRILYHIRNFALHFQYPIHYINVEFNNYVNNKPLKRDLEVMFDKNHLLSNKEFSAKMKKDLEKYGAKFPVKPIIEETLRWLPDYFLKFIQIEKSKYLAAIYRIESLGDIYKYSNIGISIKELTSTENKISTSEIPISLVQEIKKTFE